MALPSMTGWTSRHARHSPRAGTMASKLTRSSATADGVGENRSWPPRLTVPRR